MTAHDIIDNRTEKLVYHLSQILGSSERMWIDQMVYESNGLTEEEIAVLGMRGSKKDTLREMFIVLINVSIDICTQNGYNRTQNGYGRLNHEHDNGE